VRASPSLIKTTAFRLSLLYVAVFGAITALAVGATHWSAKRLYERELQGAIDAEIRGLAEQYAAAGLTRLRDLIAERSQAPGASLYMLTDPNRVLLAGNLRSVSPDLWAANGPVRFVYRRPNGLGFEERAAAVQVHGLASGHRLIVGRDIEDRRVFGALAWRSALLAIAVMMAAGAGVGLLVGRKILARIDALTAESHAILTAQRGRIPGDGSGDEIDRLTASLNDMFDRIERLMTGLREVSGNIAHDLRTPLNRLRNRAESALRGGSAGHGEALRDTIEEADEMIRTFDALLSIAQLEAGACGDFAMFDVLEAARTAAELYEPVAEAAGLRLCFEDGSPVNMRGERQLIAQAIANLLDNAIKYGQPQPGADGAIELSVARRGGAVEIAVCDRGPGVPEAERENVQKRFYRLGASRSLPGSGLGLSLVAAVAQLHSGKLRLEDNAPGLRAVLILPAPP
jgi:signal transduction histidine kinase